jgi:hypothetical protein
MAKKTSGVVLVPYYVLDLSARKCSGLVQYKFIEWIIAQSTSRPALPKSFGDRDPTEWTPAITTSSWVKLLNCEERFIQKMIKDALTRGLIERDPNEDSPIVRGYKYKLGTEAAWKSAPDYEAEKTPDPKPEEPDDEEEEEPEPVGASAGGPRRSVAPGKRLSLRFEEPAQRIEYVNDVPIPLEIVTTAVKNGVANLRVSVTDQIAKALKALKIVKTGGVLQDAPSGASTGPYTGNAVRPAGRPFPELRQQLEAELDSRFGAWGSIENEVWTRVAAELADMPEAEAAEAFLNKVELAQKKRYRVYPGLLIEWAKDFRKMWERRRPAKATAAPAQYQPSRFELWCQEHGYDPRDTATLIELMDRFDREAMVVAR